MKIQKRSDNIGDGWVPLHESEERSPLYRHVKNLLKFETVDLIIVKFAGRTVQYRRGCSEVYHLADGVYVECELSGDHRVHYGQLGDQTAVESPLICLNWRTEKVMKTIQITADNREMLAGRFGIQAEDYDDMLPIGYWLLTDFGHPDVDYDLMTVESLEREGFVVGEALNNGFFAVSKVEEVVEPG